MTAVLDWVQVVSLDHPARPSQTDPRDVDLYGPPPGPRRCHDCGVFIGAGPCKRWVLVGGLEKEWDHR